MVTTKLRGRGGGVDRQNAQNSTMALDLFAVPMMSAECERVFSAAKNLVTERRMGLKEDIIEAMYLLRHWYKEEGVI